MSRADAAPSPRIPLSQRVVKVEEGLSRVEAKIEDVGARVDGFGLNGSGPAIKALAAASADLVELARWAPALVAIATERTDAAAFWRTLQRWLRWRSGTKALVQTLFTTAIAAAAGYVAANVWGMH